MEILITEQNRNGGSLYTKNGAGYAHTIATYAMCEAYGMTMNPNVKAQADKALEVIINGQHPSGGWDYSWKQSERDDSSVMDWAAQALKAGNTCTCPFCSKEAHFNRTLGQPYVDANGKFQEIGHWINTDTATDQPIMDTCPAALQMMVYYRYLPTFKQVDVPEEVIGETQD